MNTIKYSVVFVLAIIGLFVSFILGPLNNYYGVTPINEEYIRAVNIQLWLNGLVSGLFVFMASYLFKVKFFQSAVLMLLAGFVFVLLTQGEDPEFLMSTALEFIIPYSIGGGLFFGIFFGINRLWKRG